MPLFLTHHPWSGGTMGRDKVLKMVHAANEAWRAQGFSCYSYIGTPSDGEGWFVLQAPSREALIRMFHESEIPYLTVTEVWQVGLDDLGANESAEGKKSRVV
jgi:hypothetical protein